MSENSLKRTSLLSKEQNWPEKQLNYTLALFKTSSQRTELATSIYALCAGTSAHQIVQKLLKYDTLAHVAALKLYHNRSIEFGDRSQLCN